MNIRQVKKMLKTHRAFFLINVKPKRMIVICKYNDIIYHRDHINVYRQIGSNINLRYNQIKNIRIWKR